MVEKVHTAIMDADVITAEMLVEIGNTIAKANKRLLEDGRIDLFGYCGVTADELKNVYNNAFQFNMEYEMNLAENN